LKIKGKKESHHVPKFFWEILLHMRTSRAAMVLSTCSPTLARPIEYTHPCDTHKFETYPPPFRFCPFQNHFQITYSLKPLINFSACQKRASSRTKNASNWKASTLTWHPKFKKYVTHELSEQLTKQKGAIHGAFVWTVVGFASVFTAHHLFPGFQWVLYVFSDIRRQTLALKGLLTISCKRDRLFFRLIHTQAQV